MGMKLYYNLAKVHLAVPLLLDMVTCHPPWLGLCYLWKCSLRPSSWKAQNDPVAPDFHPTGRLKPGLQWFG